MSITFVGFLLGALTVYSYLFIRRVGFVQQTVLIPFLHRLHAPNVLNTITDEEHDGIHYQIDIFNIRILTCFVAAVIASGVSALFLLLASNEGNVGITGYIVAVCFAYVCANYDLNTKMINWVYYSENELVARVMQKNADDGGHASLGDYLKAENEELIKDWVNDVRIAGEQFENRLIELGYDEERDYFENAESEQELTDMLEQVTNEMEEKEQ